MTNDELRQAIDDANTRVRTTAPDSPVHADVVQHLRALLLEQQRRCAAAPVVEPVVAPIGPLWVQPVVVQPTWVPRDPWAPPYEITCAAK